MRALALTLLLALIAGVAQAQSSDGTLRLATGQTGQTYHRVYGVRLRRFLRQFDVRFRTTDGSVQNVEMLADGDADIAFAQADVYASAVRRDPERYANILVLGRLADECVYIAHRKDGAVQSFDDLKQSVGDRRPRVAVGSPESGGSYTWSYLATLDPALEGPTLEDLGGTLAINKLAGGVIDAVVWVTDPVNLDHEMLRAVNANDDLELMDVSDPKLGLTLPDGLRIYEMMKVRTGNGWFGGGLFAPRVETVCTAALVLAREGTNPRALEIVTDAVSLNRDELIGRD
jgi:TRAP-type uncharacterized transport system substrate-binding protein